MILENGQLKCDQCGREQASEDADIEYGWTPELCPKCNREASSQSMSDKKHSAHFRKVESDYKQQAFELLERYTQEFRDLLSKRERALHDLDMAWARDVNELHRKGLLYASEEGQTDE